MINTSLFVPRTVRFMAGGVLVVTLIVGIGAISASAGPIKIPLVTVPTPITLIPKITLVEVPTPITLFPKITLAPPPLPPATAILPPPATLPTATLPPVTVPPLLVAATLAPVTIATVPVIVAPPTTALPVEPIKVVVSKRTKATYKGKVKLAKKPKAIVQTKRKK